MGWGRFQLVSLAVITGIVAARALLLWLTIRVQPFKMAQPRDLIAILGFVFFVLLLLREAQFIALPLPAFLDTLIVNFETVRRVGASLVVAGILIFILALFSFGDSWRVGIDKRTPGQLATGGLFAFSRNPIFAFMDLYLVGTFLLNGTRVFLLVAFVGILVLHLQILREERFLQSRYGPAYEDYRARTPRYFGWR